MHGTVLGIWQTYSRKGLPPSEFFIFREKIYLNEGIVELILAKTSPFEVSTSQNTHTHSFSMEKEKVMKNIGVRFELDHVHKFCWPL